jgi:hypothetical protein
VVLSAVVLCDALLDASGLHVVAYALVVTSAELDSPLIEPESSPCPACGPQAATVSTNPATRRVIIAIAEMRS